MPRKKITLACEICDSRNYKVLKSNDERLLLKKFCKKCLSHTNHKEEK